MLARDAVLIEADVVAAEGERPADASAGAPASTTTEGARVHALLIGIDCYLPNRLPDGAFYPSLGGCVRDVERVEAFLRTRVGVQASRIVKLTATDDGTGRPAEPVDRWPTYANMVAAFRRVVAAARPGDQVYVHYAGHGGRTPTIVPALKGATSLDESLVPTDIGHAEARYLRDVEIARLLREMTDAGLVVTLVFDSCHSGGATRGPAAGGGSPAGAVARGIGAVDTTVRPMESLVASPDLLAATWASLGVTRPAGATRALEGGSGWLPDGDGYTLLAACRPSEFAYEFPFEGGTPNGALTYWLLDALQQAGPRLTFKQLHDRVVSKVHTQFERQTPQLDGDGSRAVFGTTHALPAYSALVLEVADGGDTVVLAAGQAQGVRRGARFAVYPLYATDFSRADERMALIEVVVIGATTSRARVTQRTGNCVIEQGAPAVLMDPTGVRLRRRVRLVGATSPRASVEAPARLAAVAAAIAEEGSGWIEVPADAGPADYQVAVSAAGEYEVRDAVGDPVANLRPALQVGDLAAARTLARRLVHLAKYRAVQQLDNVDPTSPLAGALAAELTGAQSDFTPGEPPEPEPLQQPGDTPAIRDGGWTFLRVRNASRQVLNVAVLNLRGDWGISQIFPAGAGNWFYPLDAGAEVVIPLRGSVPAGYDEVRDVVKVFATVGPADFRQLELPPLDQSPWARPSAGERAAGTASPLDALLAAIAADRPGTRTLEAGTYPSHGWAVAQIELRVTR